MKKKQLATIVLASAMMVSSLAACGNSSDGTTASSGGEATTAAQAGTEATTTAEPDTTAPEPEKVATPSVDFEDGKFGFAKMNLLKGKPDDSVLSVVDFGGSKALKAENTNQGNMYIGINVDALLGADTAKVAKIQFGIGTGSKDGKFAASSGRLYTYTGDNLVETEALKWSVYLEEANPKIYTVDVNGFVASKDNYIIFSKETDNASLPQDLYIDDIAFLDADGNTLKANTDAVFGNPKGFAKEGKDSALVYLENPTELEGFSVSEAEWKQKGVEITDEMRALFKPGCVLEIAYKCENPVWLVNSSTDANPNPNGLWLRGIDDSFIPTGYVSTDGTVVQYTYEQLAAFWGEGWENTIFKLEAEGQNPWEVYSVKVGQQSGFKLLGNVTELEGFSVSEKAWNQKGVDVTDEMRALFKPGTVLEISYKCENPVWMICKSIDSNPNPKGKWLRSIDDTTYITTGSLNEDGTVIQYTYEQLAEFWGDGWENTITGIECEGQNDWEVYSVKVGTPIQPMTGAMEIPGFSVKEVEWKQKGVDWSDSFSGKIGMGCLFNIYYKSDAPVWFVLVGTDENPNPKGPWLRAVDENTYIVPGVVGDGFVQYSYEELAEFWGEHWETYGINQLQAEGSKDWEVYRVVIGQSNMFDTDRK